MTTFKQLTDFLVELGTDKVPHTNEVFLAHLIAVHRDLKVWGCDEELCRAGMFHSIYGTQKFQGFKLPVGARQVPDQHGRGGPPPDHQRHV